MLKLCKKYASLEYITFDNDVYLYETLYPLDRASYMSHIGKKMARANTRIITPIITVMTGSSVAVLSLIHISEPTRPY